MDHSLVRFSALSQPLIEGIPRFSRTPGTIRSGAPELGAHNEEVYRGLLGLTVEELDALRQDGVV